MQSCFIFLRIVLLSLVLMPILAVAQSSSDRVNLGLDSSYEAVVPVANQSDSERNAALSRALVQVLTKLSGDRGIASKPGISQEIKNANRYVDTVSFSQDQVTTSSGAPSYRSVMTARFKASEVDTLVQAFGLSVWPEPRPRPVLWLAIDDGSGAGPRLVGLPQANAARSVLDKAIERGFRLGLPSGDESEQALANAIWQNNVETIARASERYSPPIQLLGKLSRAGSGWVAEWTLVDSGKVLNRWTTKNDDARLAMLGGADGTADALVRKYARAGSGSNEPAGNYRVSFSNIQNANDYLKLMKLLQELAVIRKITPVLANSNTVELDLELISGLSGLNFMLTRQSWIVEGQREGQRAEYRLQ